MGSVNKRFIRMIGYSQKLITSTPIILFSLRNYQKSDVRNLNALTHFYLFFRREKMR